MSFLKALVTSSLMLAAAIVVAPGFLCYYYVPPRFWAVTGHHPKNGEELASAFQAGLGYGSDHCPNENIRRS